MNYTTVYLDNIIVLITAGVYFSAGQKIILTDPVFKTIYNYKVISIEIRITAGDMNTYTEVKVEKVD